jgi:hypothetical protein
MINHNCTSLEWITKVSALHNNADKILVEKVIRALMLLEGLAVSGLDFCFKGGTATMLLLEKPRRMSIDIDIIVPDANADIPATLDKVCAQQGFTGWTAVERQNKGLIHKTHYKLHFLSNVSRARDQFILLDVLHEQVGYSKTIQKPLTSSFIENEDAAVLVTMPDINSITGDKLTAFSPNTIGIPYSKGGHDRGMEIIKQLYDLSCLYEQVDDISIVREVFERFCAVESRYREHGFSPEAVLEDAQINALSICFRKAYDERCQYEVLSKGAKQVNGFIFSERFSNEKAMVHAAKVAYLVELVKQGINQKVLFDPAIDMRNWQISLPSDTRINKVKKSSPEGFFYLYHMVQLQEKA